MLGSDFGKRGKNIHMQRKRKNQKTNKKRTAHGGEKGKQYRSTTNDQCKAKTSIRQTSKYTEIKCKQKVKKYSE
jgi:hypothetical protein